MKKNFDREVTDIDDKPLMENGKAVLMRDVIVAALWFQQQNEMDGIEKLRRWQLGDRLRRGGDQEITPEEAALIKEVVAPGRPPFVVGPLWKYLDE